MTCSHIDVAIEMGCGKSYLTERLFECNKDLVYVNSDLNTLKKNTKKGHKNKQKIIKNENAVHEIKQE